MARITRADVIIWAVLISFVSGVIGYFSYDYYQYSKTKDEEVYAWATIVNTDHVKSVPRGQHGLHTIYYQFRWYGASYSGKYTFDTTNGHNLEHRGLGVGGSVLVRFHPDNPNRSYPVRKTDKGIHRPKTS